MLSRAVPEYSGFTDEAGGSIDIQIAATKELGWRWMELRNVDGVNFTDVTDAQFEIACEKLGDAGVGVHCFGSAIANSGKDPRNKEHVAQSFASLHRAVPRMQQLGTKFIRGMAFQDLSWRGLTVEELEGLVFPLMRRIADICEDGGITMVVENCGDYSAISPEHALRLLENVGSPALKLCYDSGNPVGTKYSSWDFYERVKPHIAHVHVKDAAISLDGQKVHTYPGDGDGDVARILADLLSSGYDGILSIEPHLHLEREPGDTRSDGEIRYASYIEYGRRTMRLVEELCR